MGLDIKSVLVADGVGADFTEILQSHGIAATNRPKISKEELINEIPNNDALVVQSAPQVTQHVLEAGANLKVARAGAGVDNIEIETTGEKDVGVNKCVQQRSTNPSGTGDH